MSLKETVEDLYVRLVGNRLVLAASLSLASSTYAYIEADDANLRFGTGGIAIYAALALMIKKCGVGTLQFYRRTEESIQKYGRLKPRVVELWMVHKTENAFLVGYCQQQGIYLAAKKHGQLEAFYEAKDKVSNVTIPHF